jgi:hypothetical protein
MSEIKGNRPGTFTKGDPRINRKGRPKSFDQLRSLAQKLSHEPIIPGEGMTAIEAILRKLARENPERFIEIAYGKVPQPVELTGKDGGAVATASSVLTIYLPDNGRDKSD